MDDNKLATAYSKIIEVVAGDTRLDHETRTALLDLAAAAMAEPTAGNLETLAMAIEDLVELEEYMDAVEKIKGIS